MRSWRTGWFVVMFNVIFLLITKQNMVTVTDIRCIRCHYKRYNFLQLWTVAGQTLSRFLIIICVVTIRSFYCKSHLLRWRNNHIPLECICLFYWLLVRISHHALLFDTFHRVTLRNQRELDGNNTRIWRFSYFHCVFRFMPWRYIL